MTDGATIVTGMDSALGRALCAEFCAKGHHVVGFAPTPADLRMAALAGPLFTGVLCDVSNPAAVADAFREVRSRVGPVGILVNVASQHPRRDFLHETAETFMGTITTNLGAVVACTREALSDMVDRGWGRILNVASLAHVPPLVPASSAYSVSQAALRTFTTALVADLADRFPNIVASDWIPPALGATADAAGRLRNEQAARLGVVLALMREPSLNGTVWNGDREVPPLRSVRRRIADRVMGRRPRVRRLA